MTDTDRTGAPLVQISVGMWNDLLGRIADLEAAQAHALTFSPDPQPPTLREQVAQAWCAEFYGEFSRSAQQPAPDQLDAADAVLAVVADWLAEQPVVPNCGSAVDGDGCFVKDQRDHDVRLLRGES